MAVRYARLWPLVVLALALLFTQLEPEPTRALPWLAAWAVWTVHIGLGLMLAVLATRATARFSGLDRRGPWPRLLLGGVLGSLAFAPLALGFERVFPVPIDGAADGLLGRWEAAGGVLALLAEWLQLAPSYLITWCLLNLVPLAPALVGTEAPAPASAPVDAGPPIDADPAGDTAEPGPTPSEPEVPAADASAGEVFFSSLPVAIGRDLVRIDADLHYLQVRTARGRAAVLATIATAERALGELGLRVHRSHWVSLRHVARLARTARGNVLILSDGSRVPVSRRRAAEVQARLGRDFVVDPAERL